MKINKKITSLIALGVLSIFTSKAFAVDTVIYKYNISESTIASELASRQTIAGNTSLIIDVGSTYSTYTPTNLNSYGQVWDLGATTALGANQITAYDSYLRSGGSLFIMGENASYGAARNPTLATFISGIVGQTVTIDSTARNILSNVDPSILVVHPTSTQVLLPYEGKFSVLGGGTCIIDSCGAAVWNLTSLTGGVYRGTIISVLDVNFLQLSNYNQTTSASSQGYYITDFTDNLIGFLTQQAILSGLIISGPTAADTEDSMTPNAYALRGSFASQSAIINTGLSYDCTTFDKNGICVSAGGRVTDTNNPSTNSQGALLIASYRANEQWRVGAYLDQNLSSNDARGVNLDNNNPMGGVFAVWNQNTDGTGYQVRLASGYSDKDVTISRSAFGATGEAGKGDSSLQSQAYSATLSRGFQLNNTRWIASPYLGVRYTKIKRAGYTEDSSADVTTPLTYSALSQETTTALVGVRFNGQLGDKINLMASAGIENDIAHNTGDYAATGVDGLTPIAFNQNVRHIRPVASAGASYAIDKRQTVGANLNFRQEAFNSTNSVSGMVTYQVGF